MRSLLLVLCALLTAAFSQVLQNRPKTRQADIPQSSTLSRNDSSVTNLQHDYPAYDIDGFQSSRGRPSQTGGTWQQPQTPFANGLRARTPTAPHTAVARSNPSGFANTYRSNVPYQQPEYGDYEFRPYAGQQPMPGSYGYVARQNSGYGYSYRSYIERQSRRYPVMIYTLVQCVPCNRAKHLLATTYPDVPSHYLELVGHEDWQRQLQADLHQMTGQVTFPYIFVCGDFIGGASNLFEMHKSGQLRQVLNNCMPRRQKTN